MQDYLGRYQDLRDEWKRKRRESTDITDDVVFEIELIRQVEINIDYILMLVKKYHDTHCEDKEVLITINKAIDASPELRSKKQLIETFIQESMMWTMLWMSGMNLLWNSVIMILM